MDHPGQKPKKSWYTIAEFAELVGKTEFTVREWCQLRRIRAEKRTGGSESKWMIPYDQLSRFGPDGLEQ